MRLEAKLALEKLTGSVSAARIRGLARWAAQRATARISAMITGEDVRRASCRLQFALACATEVVSSRASGGPCVCFAEDH